jgi:hypothetical protein
MTDLSVVEGFILYPPASASDIEKAYSDNIAALRAHRDRLVEQVSDTHPNAGNKRKAIRDRFQQMEDEKMKSHDQQIRFWEHWVAKNPKFKQFSWTKSHEHSQRMAAEHRMRMEKGKG